MPQIVRDTSSLHPSRVSPPTTKEMNVTHAAQHGLEGSHLPFNAHREGMALSDSGHVQNLARESGNNMDILGCWLTPLPVEKEDIGRTDCSLMNQT